MATEVVPNTQTEPAGETLAKIAERLGVEVVGPAAAAVDLEARYPHESMAALARERLLGAQIPKEFGGLGASPREIARVCEVLGQYCANTAMIYAMHQIQVACLVRHGTTPWMHDYLRELAEQQMVLASATTEAKIGGDVRRSICAVERDGNTFQLSKNAPVISYGEHADDILVTARRAPDSAPNDQVIVVARRASTTLTPTSGWDTLGFRGTCSLGFQLSTSGVVAQIVPVPYETVSSHTMLPSSHIFWSSLWLGIAIDAVRRARAYIRAEARKTPGSTPPGSMRLAEVVSVLQTMEATVHNAIDEYERVRDDPETLSGMGFSLRMNNLKIAASQLVVEIVTQSLGICGISGYRRDSKFSVERHLRDAYGAALMVNNDRIYGNNATMLLVHKDA